MLLEVLNFTLPPDNKNTVSELKLKHKQRILHGRAEIQNFSSSVEKYFTSEHSK